MRKVFLTVALVCLLAIPVLAQFRMGGTNNPDMLLMNKSVREELKLTEKQTKALDEIDKAAKENREKVRAAFKDGDKDKGMDLMKKGSEETIKKLDTFKETLTTAQRKRFQEIEVQVATKNSNPDVFSRPNIQKALSLTDKQKTTVKDTLADLGKDVKEVQDDAKGDFKKMFAAMKKITGLRKKAFDTITKSLTEEQAKTWKEMAGEKFEMKNERPKGKGKFKDSKKSDEF